MNNGVKMPWIGLGTMYINESNGGVHAIKSAIQTGYHSIDTASALKEMGELTASIVNQAVFNLKDRIF